MYAQLNDLKDAIGSTTASDAYLTKLLQRATAYVEKMTNRKWNTTGAPITVTDEVYRHTGRIIWLPPGASDVTSVKTKATRSGTYLTLNTDTYDWDERGRLVLPYGGNFVAVTYTLPVMEVPLDIEMATLSIAQQLYSAGFDQQKGTVKAERVGDWSVTYSDSKISTVIGADVLDILNMYRLRPV